jgi:hypothetical protein
LHLNSIEKEKVAILIVQYLTNLLTKQENNIFTLPWIDDSKDANLLKEKEGIEDMLSLEMFVNKVKEYREDPKSYR